MYMQEPNVEGSMGMYVQSIIRCLGLASEVNVQCVDD